MFTNSYFANRQADSQSLAFSFLWVGNHIGEAAGGMTVKERMSALNACDEILASQSSDENASDTELFVSALMVVGGDNAQLLLDAYNADPRSTEQGLKDTVRILMEYAESGQSGAVEQSTFFLNALVKMAKAVIDESEVSSADMKSRNNAFDAIKDLVSSQINSTKAKPETKQNNKSSKFDNKTNKSSSSNISKARSPGRTPLFVISGALIFAISVLLISFWLRRDTPSPSNNNQPSVQAEQLSDSSSGSDSVSPESAIDSASDDWQDRKRIAAEIELAKAKKDLLIAERALMEEQRLSAASVSNSDSLENVVKRSDIECQHSVTSPLVCESRQDQPAMCAWSYSSCGSPRLQKKLSKSSCNNRVTLDVQNNQIIVTAGCRAQFVPEIE
jgi:hypothetical protein